MRVHALLLSSLLLIGPLHASVQAQFVSAAPMQPSAADTGRSVIYASGMARQATTFDRASLVFLLETPGMSVEEASSRLAAVDRAVQDTLRRFNLPAGSVRSYVGGVAPYRPQNMPSSMMGGPTFSGRSTIRVESVSIDQIGPLTAAALAKGATSVLPATLVASASDSIRRSLIPKAFETARRDAEVLAHAAGGQLGRLLTLNVSPMPSDFQQQLVSGPYYENGPRPIPNPMLMLNVNASWLLVRQ
ncbi:MAG: SIMPL domain-containing protein [Gemmatimonadaceae bacterium]